MRRVALAMSMFAGCRSSSPGPGMPDAPGMLDAPGTGSTDVTLIPQDLDFGNTLGSVTKTVRIANDTLSAIQIDSIDTFGESFALDATACVAASLAPGSSCELAITTIGFGGVSSGYAVKYPRHSITGQMDALMSGVLDITIVGPGTVSDDNGNVDCDASCAPTLTGAPLLIATPTGTATFVGWSVAACGNAPMCRVEHPSSITATFTP